MATVIQIKRGTGTSAPGSLVAGELAATLGAGTQGNAGDRLFIGDGSNVDVVGGKYFTDMMDQAHGTLTAASTVIVDSNKAIDELIVGNHASNGGSLKFQEGTNNGSHYMALKAPNAVTANVTLTLPDGAGSSGQYLKTDGTDTLSWGTVVSSFTVAADSGSDDTFNTGETFTLAGGTGIDSTVSNNQVSFAIDSTVATLTGSQTLTNKTLTSPVLNSPTIGTQFTIGSATITEAELEILDGANVTTAELNIMDGNTSVGNTAFAGGDGLVTNDNGTMQQTSVDTLDTYLAATTKTLTNKTLTSPVVTTPQINDSSADHQYVFAVSELAADRTVTLPLLAGNDEFTFNAHTQTLTNKTIALGSNTVSGTLAQFQTAVTDATLVDLDDSQTLSNKTLASPVITTQFSIGSAVITEAELEILDGATATTAELNIIDGDTSATSTTVADADRVVMNDNGTMVQVAVTDLAAYFDDEITAMPNLVTTAATTVGALDSGSITSGFGSINNGSSAITTSGNLTGGTVIVGGGSGNATLKSNGNHDIIIQTGNSTTGSMQITDGANGDISLSPNGTGTVVVPSGYKDRSGFGATSLATKEYVDAVKAGLTVKDSVRAATTANITIASALNNGDTLDGVTLADGDRVLVKNQSTGSQNGIYIVGSSPARSTDMAAGSVLDGGTFVFVEEGTANADNGYVVSTDGTITVNTTAHVWTQFSGAGQITAGDGLAKGSGASANTMNAVVDNTTTKIVSDAIVVKSSGTAGQVLRSDGNTNAAAWGQLNLASGNAVTGTLPYSLGGTGLTTYAKGSVVVANAADTLSALDGGGSNDGVLFYTASSDTIAWATSLDGGTF